MSLLSAYKIQYCSSLCSFLRLRACESGPYTAGLSGPATRGGAELAGAEMILKAKSERAKAGKRMPQHAEAAAGRGGPRAQKWMKMVAALFALLRPARTRNKGQANSPGPRPTPSPGPLHYV